MVRPHGRRRRPVGEEVALAFLQSVFHLAALIGIVFPACLIFFGLPDRSTAEPAEQPPKAVGKLAEGPRVAGAGIVEPSSEVIDIGSALSGLVTDVQVKPGDKVAAGEVLFLVDARAARARKGKAADLGFKPNRITRVE